MENHTNQIHDFNPGFGEPVNAAGDRTFWTIAVPAPSVQALPGNANATLAVRDLEVEDYFNLTNALADGASADATVSFSVRWSGPVTRTVTVADPATDFTGRFLENRATVSWSATEEGFTFVSDPASTSTTVFAQVGHERNGIFFQAERSSSHGSRGAPGAASKGAFDSIVPPPFGALSDSLLPSGASADVPPAERRGSATAVPTDPGRPLPSAIATDRLPVLDHLFADLGAGPAADLGRANALDEAP